MLPVNAPRFSVIVPTYNRAASIVPTLESLRAQQFDDFEVIVVDDGSVDDTAEVVKQVELERFTYRWQPNAGPSVARNLGADIASGKFVVFIDTGDRAHADWLASFDRMIRAYDCSVVSCGADLTRGGVVVRSIHPRQHGPGAGRVIGLFRTGCFAVQRDLFHEVGGFDAALRFSEASELGMRIGQRLAGQGNALSHVSRSLVAIELPPDEGVGGRATSLAYSDQRRLDTAAYILDKHATVMASTPTLRHTYLRVAGVASARLGAFSQARRYFVDAWRSQPKALSELARAGATLVPGVRSRVWPPKG